jgi:hypothetical protein
MTDEELEREDLVIGRVLHALDTIDVDNDVDIDDDAREYFEVVSHLPFDEITPPADLEARVLDAAREVRAPEVPSLASRRRRARRIVAVGAAAAVAAAVTLVVIAGGGSNGSSTVVNPIGIATPATITRIADTHGASKFELRSTTNGRRVASVAVTPRGELGLYDLALPRDGAGVYRFWVTGSGHQVQVPNLALENGTSYIVQVHGELTGAMISLEHPGASVTAPTLVIARGSVD